MPKPGGYSSLRWRRIESRVRRNCRKAKNPDACTQATLRRIAAYIEARNRKQKNLERQEKVGT